MPRFEEDVNIQPINPSTGAAQGLMTLSDKLDAFSGQMAVQAEAYAVEKGREAGLNEGAKGELALKEETFFGGAGKKAYNEGLRASYLAGIARDNRLAIAKAHDENPDNIAGFRESTEAIRQGLNDELDPSVRRLGLEQFDDVSSQYEVRVQRNDINRVKTETLADLGTAAAAAYDDAAKTSREGNSEDTLRNLAEYNLTVASMDIPDREKAKMMDGAALGVESERYRGMMVRLQDEQGIQAVYDYLQDNEDAPPGFTPEEWDTLTASLQTEANRIEQRRRVASKEEIQALELQASEDRGAEFIDRSVHASPHDKQDREDIDNYYNSISNDMNMLSKEGWVNAHVDLITAQSDIVPSAVINAANTMLLSGEPEQVEMMANFFGRLREENSRAINDFPAETRAMAANVSNGLATGLTPEQATESGRKMIYGMSEAEKDVIKEQTVEAERDRYSTLEDNVLKSTAKGGYDAGPLGGLFNSVPDIPMAMQADNKVAFKRFMAMTGGNAVESNKLAYESTTKLWGVTDVGGESRFMKYSPEALYAGKDNAWVSDQFNLDMENAKIEGGRIVADADTLRNSPPDWLVMGLDDNGNIGALYGEDGNPLRWRPDYKETQEHKDTQVREQGTVESSKARLQRRAENRAGVIRRDVTSRVLSNVPRSERSEFMKSTEGMNKTAIAIQNMVATGRLAITEAEETAEAFGVDLRPELLWAIEKVKANPEMTPQALKEEARQAAIKEIYEPSLNAPFPNKGIEKILSETMEGWRADAKKKYGGKK